MPYSKMLKRFIGAAGIDGSEGALFDISKSLISAESLITAVYLPARRNALAIKLLDVIGLTKIFFHRLENFLLLLGQASCTTMVKV